MRKYFIIAISAIVFMAFIIVNIVRHSDKKEVLNDYSYTLGEIVSYRKIGDHRNRTLTYKYTVRRQKLTRTISPELDFSDCEKDITLCQQRRFIVIYSNKDVSKSLIDLKNEFKITQELKAPENLENFE